MIDLMSKIISLCKRRGFVFPSSEIYGGFGSCYDFGPLGVLMKNNIKRVWWDEMTKKHENMVGLDAAILMSPKVWQASGHLTAGFADELVECKNCHKRFRIDEFPNSKFQIPNPKQIQNSKFKIQKCLECRGELTKPRKFNLMMKTLVGPVEEEATTTYLRAETCQGIYVNFENVLQSMRLKIPFGIAQIGKVFRNEITPKDFIYRTREFEQMEMQWFCKPSRINANLARSPNVTELPNNKQMKDWIADDWFEYWLKERLKWIEEIGIKKENLRIFEVPEKERAHYARRQIDIEYKFPFGWKEIEGIHNRGDWDLSNHSKHSGKDLRYFDDETNERYFPYIIETSVGVDRLFFALLCDAYEEVKGGRTTTTEAKKEIEIVLKLHKSLAPIKVAVLPLVRNKPELVKKAKEVYQVLMPYFNCQYDELGAIGRRYRRQDEIGTVVSATVDFQTLKDNTITLRDRDSMKQIRVEISELKDIVQKILQGENFLKLGNRLFNYNRIAIG